MRSIRQLFFTMSQLVLPYVGVNAWITKSVCFRHATCRTYDTTSRTSLLAKTESDDLLANKKLKTYTITWRTEESSENINENKAITFHAYDGETLRTAALRRNVASPHNGRANLINCRGLGTCGTCAVEIVSGHVEPIERNQIEQLRFNFPPHNFHNNTKLRLACQIQVKGDVEIIKRTGFWGQQKKLATLSTPKLYFGELEYFLDNKSLQKTPERSE